MERVEVSSLKNGMILAKDIYSGTGGILLAKGIVLKEKYIERLKDLNINSAFVKNLLLEGVEINDTLDDLTRANSINNLENIFKNFAGSGEINIKSVKLIVDDIIDNLLRNKGTLVNINDIRSHDKYTFHHSVNVCSLAIMTGIKLGYNQLQMKNLGIGSLLHDLGKIFLELKILNKPGKLTTEEIAIVEQHPQKGYHVLKEKREISALSSTIALYHHEKFDGTGYPTGLKGKDIHEFARIVAICDVFDAVSSDRPYKKAAGILETNKLIAANINSHFDPFITDKFMENIAIFPIGTVVVLNTGEIGLVVKNEGTNREKPVVRIIGNINNPHMDCTKEVNLSLEQDKFIVEVKGQ